MKISKKTNKIKEYFITCSHIWHINIIIYLYWLDKNWFSRIWYTFRLLRSRSEKQNTSVIPRSRHTIWESLIAFFMSKVLCYHQIFTESYYQNFSFILYLRLAFKSSVFCHFCLFSMQIETKKFIHIYSLEWKWQSKPVYANQ